MARKYGVYERLPVNTKVIAAEWAREAGQWRLALDDVAAMRTYSEEFHVMITAIGRFNARKLPEYPGIESYSGRFRHASDWDPIFNSQGKSFTVIGNGASGIEEVANLQKMASRLNHYARSPTWIAGSFAGEDEGRNFKPSYHLPETLRSFENSTVYLEFRKKFEGNSYGRFETMLRDSEGNKQLRKEFKTSMAEWTKDEPELLEHLLPNFVAQLQMTHSWTRISRGLVQRRLHPYANCRIHDRRDRDHGQGGTQG